MKRKTIYLYITLLIGLLTACDGITYEGDFTNDGTYQGLPRVYFNATDTMKTVSFGLDADTVKMKTLLVPVKLTGARRTQPMTVVLEVDPSSTAVQGKQYELGEVTFDKDSLTAYIKLTVLRSGLPSDEEGNYFVNLHLKSTAEYSVDSNNFSTSVKIKMNDYLAKPAWWDTFSEGVAKEYYYGEFTRIKYLKWLEYYGFDEKKMEISIIEDLGYNWIYTTLKSTYLYFKNEQTKYSEAEYGVFGSYIDYI